MPPKKIERPKKGEIYRFNQHAIQPPMKPTTPNQASQQEIQQDSQYASSSSIGKKIRKLGLRGPSFRVGGITYVGIKSSEARVPIFRRNKMGVRIPTISKSTTKFQDVNDVAQVYGVNDIPLVEEKILIIWLRLLLLMIFQCLRNKLLMIFLW